MNNIEKITVNTMRTLAVDAIQKAKSGHPGMAIGAAPMALTIWRQMRHNPKNPDWRGRDRFVLSAGHASMLEYTLLHLFGYGVTVEDIKNFRQWGSKTPGHPEIEHTRGVEASTGPLGQGFCMAVGMAMAEAHLAALFNKDGYPVFDNYTYVLMGDGCMMEGATSEAASLAGTLGLNKLIALYDSNRITIEGDTSATFAEDVAKRFEAYGFHVQNVADGEDMEGIQAAIDKAKAQNDKPSLIIVNTMIAHGTEKAGKANAHGEPLGDENIAKMKAAMGWEYAPFEVPAEVSAYFNELSAKYEAMEADYNEMLAKYEAAYPELYEQLTQWQKNEPVDISYLFETKAEGSVATRKTSGKVLNQLFEDSQNFIGGSADLAPSNMSKLNDSGYFAKGAYENCNIHFGVRELAMAACCNGMALYGGLRPFCSTFMVFSDYLKPALRLSALMKLNVIYVLTHDSIGVGEDGPTHHPIEQLATLRSIPGNIVFRPADTTETVAAYIAAQNANGPACLALSRQNLPELAETSSAALRGGYILRDAKDPDVILIASGSEVELIYKAAEILTDKGYKSRLVSMPCMELFESQSAEYKESVLPSSMRKRVACEAGSSMPWYKYVGLDGATLCIDHFGASAPASVLFKEFGFTAEKLAELAEQVINK